MTPSPAPRTLFLHAGPHKTGTTSIQGALDQRRDALAGRGIHAYREDHGPGIPAFNAYELAHAVLRPDLLTPMRKTHGANRPPAEGPVRAFRDFAQSRPGGGSVVVSAEAFCFLRTSAEMTRLQEAFACFDRIRILLVRRRKPDWRRSWIASVRRQGLGDGPQDTAPDHPRARIDGDWYFDWAAVLGFWRQIGQIKSLDYDAEMRARGSILPGFFRWLGCADLSRGLNVFLNKTIVEKG